MAGIVVPQAEQAASFVTLARTARPLRGAAARCTSTDRSILLCLFFAGEPNVNVAHTVSALGCTIDGAMESQQALRALDGIIAIPERPSGAPGDLITFAP